MQQTKSWMICWILIKKMKKKQRKLIQQEMFAKPKNYDQREICEIVIENFNNNKGKWK